MEHFFPIGLEVVFIFYCDRGNIIGSASMNSSADVHDLTKPLFELLCY